MLANTEERSDDTSLSCKSVCGVAGYNSAETIFLQKEHEQKLLQKQQENVNESSWTGSSMYICTWKSQVNNVCTDLASRTLMCVCHHICLQNV